MLGDTEIEKQKFHYHKKPVLIEDVDINKIITLSKVSFGKKGFRYFIGYKDDEKGKPLGIMYNASKNEWIYNRF